MILPFDYPTYYETGNPLEAMKVAIQNPIVRRMYELPFKVYMMDEFMYYFGGLGYPPNRVQELVNLPELELYDKAAAVSAARLGPGR